MIQSLQIHHHEPGSRVNGPGARFVIWTQGCTLACPGCFNPDTHPLKSGYALPVDGLTALILESQHQIEGLTISGGEPLLQCRALGVLLAQIKANSSLTTLLFSGFDWAEIQKITFVDTVLSNLDILISGRYRQSQRVANHLIGSKNKTVHFLTSRYTLSDLALAAAEVIISNDGTITLSGINPLTWEQW
jgi:anaerobic ribonucleoside-triphosphate reductase activating protein